MAAILTTSHPYSSVNDDCSQDSDLQAFTDCPPWIKPMRVAYIVLGRWNRRPASDGEIGKAILQDGACPLLIFIFTLVLQ